MSPILDVCGYLITSDGRFDYRFNVLAFLNKIPLNTLKTMRLSWGHQFNRVCGTLKDVSLVHIGNYPDVIAELRQYDHKIGRIYDAYHNFHVDTERIGSNGENIQDMLLGVDPNEFNIYLKFRCAHDNQVKTYLDVAAA